MMDGEYEWGKLKGVKLTIRIRNMREPIFGMIEEVHTSTIVVATETEQRVVNKSAIDWLEIL